mmetsp:Transcript_21717/g.68024  ORF Transcript_21717/g.68024 Transcript_21717/m.68024 type:complete len:303 (+) Transcript_21717:2388-3296(+)
MELVPRRALGEHLEVREDVREKVVAAHHLVCRALGLGRGVDGEPGVGRQSPAEVRLVLGVEEDLELARVDALPEDLERSRAERVDGDEAAVRGRRDGAELDDDVLAVRGQRRDEVDAVQSGVERGPRGLVERREARGRPALRKGSQHAELLDEALAQGEALGRLGAREPEQGGAVRLRGAPHPRAVPEHRVDVRRHQDGADVDVEHRELRDAERHVEEARGVARLARRDAEDGGAQREGEARQGLVVERADRVVEDRVALEVDRPIQRERGELLGGDAEDDDAVDGASAQGVDGRRAALVRL